MQTKPDCPYCSLAEMRGELFCSRHATDSAHLKSGMFLIREQAFEECDWHKTRLSLNFNLDHTQSYFVGNRQHNIGPDRFLLINDGQQFKTFARNQRRSRMLTIAYQVGMPEKLHRALFSSHAQLLDTPLGPGNADFFDQTFPLDGRLYQKISTLCASYRELDEEDVQDHLENILQDILATKASHTNLVQSIDRARRATRQEIYKRLTWALEYIDNNFTQNFSVDELAAYACMSPFHFKRLFRQVYKEPPYQYIRRKRMEEAKQLLRSGCSVADTCIMVGWENPSSFIRLFKKFNSVTPGMYQNLFSESSLCDLPAE